MRLAVLLLALSVLVPGGTGCAGSPPAPAPSSGAPPSAENSVPGEYIVTLAPGADVAVLRQVYGRFGLRKAQELGGGLFLVGLGEDPGLARMKELQMQDPRIRAVQPNFVYRALP
jgi:hypothetical protein